MYFYYNTGTWRSNILRKWFNWANIIRTISGSSLCVQCRDMTIAWLKDCIQKSCRPRNQKAVSLLTRFCRQTRAQTRKPLQKLAVRLFTVSAPGDDIYKVSGRRVQGSRGEGEKVQKHTPLSQQTLLNIICYDCSLFCCHFTGVNLGKMMSSHLLVLLNQANICGFLFFF